MRTLLVALVFVLIAAFLAINWTVFSAPARISLVFAVLEIPYGLVMLAILILVALTFGSYAVVSWSAILLEFRRQAKELQAQRTLAETAEAELTAENLAADWGKVDELKEEMERLRTASAARQG